VLTFSSPLMNGLDAVYVKELGTPTEKIWSGVSELPAMKKCTFTEYPYNQLRGRFGSLLSDRGFDLLNKCVSLQLSRSVDTRNSLVCFYLC